MKKIQFILMASFVLGTCQLAVLSGAADEPDVKESTIELSNNFVENSQVDNVQISSETTSEQVVEKAESNSETKENSLLPSSQTGVAETEVRSEEVSVETYEKNLENLKPVSYSDVTNMLTEDGGDHILYVGRPTCYYCRQNSPVLKDFNTLIDGQLLYYNTDSDQLDRESRKILFDKLGIPGTPSVIRLKNGQLVSGYLGSAPDAQAIYQAVFKEETEKTETREGTEVVEKAENPLPESPSEDTIKYGGENTVNHTDQSVNSLMSQIKQVFRNLTDLLISLLGKFF
ncbi:MULTISPECIES: thioredoxin family protein [Streptococcus]|jgi:predicted bacteriocin transport accessory protein|uniref:thioredoxin family protein n=1 Tax=Streptococcus TaxID=1301 RepID=UPI000335AEA9|nr:MULTISPECIES: thioredoxin family protein [Streptococcus]MBS5746645.1 thiol reductase thioredoxin [Streptococcus sp.]CDF02399.1 thioredoxin domain-containing protein [Streptococcus salivarius CAG:79]ETS92467.1 putative bacteriocin transport accessory protein [Streptococcus sp. SR4]MDB8592343.1 thioredoxin family protein [Streptococcus salivarius]MDB8594799.1 thioredoxin family protein [Streptococcus salivarius]